jgi:hypothetical protein
LRGLVGHLFDGGADRLTEKLDVMMAQIGT